MVFLPAKTGSWKARGPVGLLRARGFFQHKPVRGIRNTLIGNGCRGVSSPLAASAGGVEPSAGGASSVGGVSPVGGSSSAGGESSAGGASSAGGVSSAGGASRPHRWQQCNVAFGTSHPWQAISGKALGRPPLAPGAASGTGRARDRAGGRVGGRGREREQLPAWWSSPMPGDAREAPSQGHGSGQHVPVQARACVQSCGIACGSARGRTGGCARAR